MYYAWVSPCSGGCSQVNDLLGWHYCSDAQWAARPSKDALLAEGCSAFCFDPSHDHCDYGKSIFLASTSYPSVNFNRIYQLFKFRPEVGKWV